MRNRIFLIGGFFLISLVIFLLDRVLATGLLFFCLLVFSTLLILKKIVVIDKKLYALILVGILVHLFVALFIYYANFNPFSGGSDSDMYHQTAIEISRRFKEGNFSLSGLYLNHYFPVIIGIIYLVILPNQLVGQMFAVWLFIVSIIILYFLISEIGGSAKMRFFAILAVIFYPSYLYFGSTLLKDIIVVPLILSGLLLSVKMYKNFKALQFLSFFITLTGLIHLRFYIGFALMFSFIICWFLISNFNRRNRLIYGIVFIFLLGFSPQILGNGYYGHKSIQGFLSPQRIAFFREIVYAPTSKSISTPTPALVPAPTPVSALTPASTSVPITIPTSIPTTAPVFAEEVPGGKGSSYIIETGFDKGVFSFLKNYSLSFAYAILGPPPWQLKEKRHLFFLLETIPLYFLFSFSIFNIFKKIKKEKLDNFLKIYKFTLPMLVFSLMAFGALSLYINNFGIIARIRIPMLISLLAVATLFDIKRTDKSAEKSESKIAFLSPILEGGGAERNLVNLVGYFNGKYQMEVWSGKIGKDFFCRFLGNVKIVEFKNHSDIVIFLHIAKLLIKEKPDILVSSFPHINTACIMAKFFIRSKTKIILTEHTTFSHIPPTARTSFRRFAAKSILPHFMRFFYPKADAVICVSRGVAEDLLLHIPKLKKIHIIYNPIADKSIIESSKESVDFPWFKDQKEPIVISAGRLVKAKDYPCLLGAFKMVLRKKPCKLVILGEGEERQKLENLSRDLSISENIAFLGFQKNPFKYMAKSSVFVLSSVREGFGNVVVESMALGVPVVSTDSVGPKEIIENNKNGILVPLDDENLLAEAMLKILENPDFARKLSEEGLKRSQDFTIEKGAEEYEKIFQKLLT